jgi:pimeloyl-ACP methyl ester carboxylesterase
MRTELPAEDATPLLFIHGSLASGRMWAPYLAAYPDRPAGVVDLPGYGAAASPPADRPYRLADAVAAVQERAGLGPGPVDIVAHSFGAAVALRLALTTPRRVRRLVLIEPTCFNLLRQLGPKARDARRAIEAIAVGLAVADSAQTRRAAMARFVDYWNGRGCWDALPESKQAGFTAQAGQVRRDFEALFRERLTLASLRRLTGPVLLVGGTESPASVALIGEAIASAAPQADTVAVRGAGHMLPVTHVTALSSLLDDIVIGPPSRPCRAAVRHGRGDLPCSACFPSRTGSFAAWPPPPAASLCATGSGRPRSPCRGSTIGRSTTSASTGP